MLNCHLRINHEGTKTQFDEAKICVLVPLWFTHLCFFVAVFFVA
jgi:hypothetical protein